LTAAMGEMELPVALHDASFEDVILALVPSWVEKGPKSVSKKLWYLIAILSLCMKATSKTFSEIHFCEGIIRGIEFL